MLPLAVFSLTGCSSGEVTTYPVYGVVRFPDGKLLREGTIEFEISGVQNPVTATGEIAPDGSFFLGTYQIDDGAVAGRHRVVVIADSVIGTGVERPGLLPKSILHPKYRDFNTSDIVIDIQPATNNVVIDVEYAQADEAK
ncbi:hypothetical protein RMSM_02146 [Rhodopirellula maiorica SM1]|uniref:Uncharacterized protein n=1 Tax=Rhodopirellula maiorica SM1 TaxID=1265738 RepID=M5S422_9BACT|nr:hypothetical protein RMSM_02146 [Rhodopirellula maiorica SM1]